MIGVLRTRHQLYTNTDAGMNTTQFKHAIEFEHNPIVNYCAKRKSVLQHYVCIVKYLLWSMLAILQHMIRNCHCAKGGPGCHDTRCRHDTGGHRRDKGDKDKDACAGICSSKHISEDDLEASIVKEELEHCSNLGYPELLNDPTVSAMFCPSSLNTDADDLDANTNVSKKELLPDQNEIDLRDQFLIASTSNKNEVEGEPDVHQATDSQDNLDMIRNEDSDSTGNTPPETEETTCWQETDDPIASIRTNQKLETRLQKIFHSAALETKCGAAETLSFSEYTDVLSNDSDKPLENNSLQRPKREGTVEDIVEVNTVLAVDHLFKKDVNNTEFLELAFMSKKVEPTSVAANHICSKALAGTFDNHLHGRKKQHLGKTTRSKLFCKSLDVDCDLCKNDYIDNNSKFYLEGTNKMQDGVQLNNDQKLFSNPLMIGQNNDIAVVPLEGVLVEYQKEEIGALQEVQVADTEQEAVTEEDEGAEGDEGEEGGGGETAGDEAEAGDQSTEEKEGGKEGSKSGDAEGGEGGENEGGNSGEGKGNEGGGSGGNGGEGNDYVMMMMRLALGPSADEAVVDAMDVIKRIGDFIKGSILQGEGGGGGGGGGEDGGDGGGGEADAGGSSEGETDEGAQEEGAQDEGAAEGGDEAGGEEQGAEGESEPASGEDEGAEQEGNPEEGGEENAEPQDEEKPPEEEQEVGNENLEDDAG